MMLWVAFVLLVAVVDNCHSTNCFFGGKPYKFGTHTKNVCVTVVCIFGEWKSNGLIHSNCGICRAYLDPHILTYAKGCTGSTLPCAKGDSGFQTYAFQEDGIYSLTQVDNSINPTWAVDSEFKDCGFATKHSVSCVEAVTFKNDPGTIITINAATMFNVLVIGDVLDTTPRIVKDAAGVPQPMFAWKSNDIKCLKLLGKCGIMVQFCKNQFAGSNSVYVWTAPIMKQEPLGGLCGNFTYDGFTDRDGKTWPWNKYDIPEAFYSTWEVNGDGTVNNERSKIRVKRQTQNRCESNSSALADIQSQCTTTAITGFPNDVLGEVPALISACVYDLCRVEDPTAWLKAVEQTVAEHAAIREITIDFTAATQGPLPTSTPTPSPSDLAKKNVIVQIVQRVGP